jgi:uncharacterized protein (TIGR03086 family)
MIDAYNVERSTAMTVEPLTSAVASTRTVLGGVKPDQLDQPTPCVSWKVSDLINHIVGGQFFFAAMVRGEQPTRDATDYAAGDFLESFERGSAEAVAAFGAPGAMERIVHLPFGDLPASVFINIASTDTFIHGWDLARATSQASELDPQLALVLLDRVRPVLMPSLRGPDGKAPFGPEQPAPEDATDTDKLAAFLGRAI